jgi:DNA-binding NtrC family response regulator
MGVQRVDLTPLCHRCAEIADLARQAVARIRPEARVRSAPATIQELAAQAWPGNLHELTMVTTHAVAHRVVGDIGLADLPEAYRSTTPQKPLAGMEGLNVTPSCAPWPTLMATR